MSAAEENEVYAFMAALRQIDRGIIKQLDYLPSFSLTPLLSSMARVLTQMNITKPFDSCLCDSSIFMWHNYAIFMCAGSGAVPFVFIFSLHSVYDFTRMPNEIKMIRNSLKMLITTANAWIWWWYTCGTQSVSGGARWESDRKSREREREKKRSEINETDDDI